VRAVVGPTRKGAARIGEEVLRSRKFVYEARAIAESEKIVPQELEKRARSNLREIAAEPKPWPFQVARPFLSWVWNRIYDGFEIDREGLERVRAAARKGPLVLVPSHKSHVDYLVLSYFFSENALVPPLIAAGANLSFWPLGWFFRRAGAFFLRRTFKGDRLYGAVFRAYVRKLLREGYSVEFFIEGGRSRTGKLLAPRLGLLGMIVEAALEDDGARARRAQVVPISIGYEKVIEEKSYAHEAAGGEKKAEDVRGLLKATKVLRGQYGRLNIQFDEPFPLVGALREYGALVAWDEDDNSIVPADEEARRLATLRLGHRIVYGINRVTAVTPTALTAATLLGSGKRGTSRRELVEHATFLMSIATAAGGRLSESLVDERGALDLEALDRALELLQSDGDVEVRAAAERMDEIYTIPDERRPRLAYYRNNAIHLLVADSLVCYALGERPDGMALGELRARTLAASRLLKLEFGYRVGESFDQIFDGRLAGLLARGVFLLTGGIVTAPAGQSAARRALLGGMVFDFVESYWIVVDSLHQGGAAAQPVSDKDLIKKVQEHGEKLFFTGEITRREACVRASYQNAIDYLRERGALVERDKKLGVDAARLQATRSEIADLRGPGGGR
jgi:glycerol-3-phosphate O-acyltransferase